jgi:hypothetical protein
MRPEELMELLRARPFVPLRLHITGGHTYDIRHPDQVLVTRSRAVIEVGADPASGVLERTEYMALVHVVRIEKLPQLAIPGNGRAA